MKYKLIYSFLCFVFWIGGSAKPLQQPVFDKSNFYAVMASGNLDKINDELEVVRAANIAEKDAFEGALLMRKAGVLKKANEKLKAFKAGRIKFDTALQEDSDNAEYRFLRLTIQEHAPKVVKYNQQVEADSRFIKKVYKTLSPAVQQAIMEYSKTSTILRVEDL